MERQVMIFNKRFKRLKKAILLVYLTILTLFLVEEYFIKQENLNAFLVSARLIILISLLFLTVVVLFWRLYMQRVAAELNKD